MGVGELLVMLFGLCIAPLETPATVPDIRHAIEEFGPSSRSDFLVFSSTPEKPIILVQTGNSAGCGSVYISVVGSSLKWSLVYGSFRTSQQRQFFDSPKPYWSLIILFSHFFYFSTTNSSSSVSHCVVDERRAG